MKFQLEVQDNKVAFFLELIKGFKFIKAKPVNAENDADISEESLFEESFNRAIEDKEMGRTRPHSEVRKKYEKWL